MICLKTPHQKLFVINNDDDDDDINDDDNNNHHHQHHQLYSCINWGKGFGWVGEGMSVTPSGLWWNAERWKWRNTGQMPNIIGRYAERVQCRKLNSTTLVTFVRTMSSFINLWCAQIRHFSGFAFSSISPFLVRHFQVVQIAVRPLTCLFARVAHY